MSSAGVCQLVNALKGSDSPHVIPTQSKLYNNLLYSEGVGGTLCTHSLKMLQTKHQIMKVVVKNKTYSKLSHLPDEVTAAYQCSLGESGADLSMHHTIGDEFI